MRGAAKVALDSLHRHLACSEAVPKPAPVLRFLANPRSCTTVPFRFRPRRRASMYGRMLGQVVAS